MKKLQNNFTTPEQSKRLLKLGIPADSADCAIVMEHEDKVPIVLYEESVSRLQEVCFNLTIIPCWSVGRLIEIVRICAGMEYVDFETLAWVKGKWSKKLVKMIKDLVKYDKIDFTKLEE